MLVLACLVGAAAPVASRVFLLAASLVAVGSLFPLSGSRSCLQLVATLPVASLEDAHLPSPPCECRALTSDFITAFVLPSSLLVRVCTLQNRLWSLRRRQRRCSWYCLRASNVASHRSYRTYTLAPLLRFSLPIGAGYTLLKSRNTAPRPAHVDAAWRKLHFQTPTFADELVSASRNMHLQCAC